MVVRVVLRVGAEAVVEVAEDLLGQERVLGLEGVGRRVEVDFHEVGLDHAAPRIFISDYFNRSTKAKRSA